MSFISFIGGKYIETTGRDCQTFAKGNIAQNSIGPIQSTSVDGCLFGKPEKFVPKTDLLVTKVEGPFDDKGGLVKIVTKGFSYSYKAILSREPTLEEIKMLRWAVKSDNGKIIPLSGVSSFNSFSEGKILIGITINKETEKARIYAYYKKPNLKASIEIKLGPLQHIIVIGTQNHRGDTSITNPLSWVRDVGPGSKLMFALQAIRRVRLNKDVKFTILMCEDGYKASHIKAVKNSIMNLYGSRFIQVNSSQQIINYINTGDVNNSNKISTERKNKVVKQLIFYSHGLVGKIALGMGLTGDDSAYVIEEKDVLKFSKEAFTSDSHIYSFACRTGLGNTEIDKSIYKTQISKSNSIGMTSMGIPLSQDEFETVQMPLYSAQSIAQKLSNQTNAIVYAYLRRSDYEDTLFTKDELCFSDYMKMKEGNTSITPNKARCGNKYDYLLNTNHKLTESEKKRWEEWKIIDSNNKKIDDAFFDPDGARHNVKAAPSPIGVPAEMQTFKPIK